MVGGGVATDGPQAHYRCLRGRPQTSPPPLSDLLHIASRVRNKRNSAGLAPASAYALQSSMGDDQQNSAKLKDEEAWAVLVAARWQSAWWWLTLKSMRLGPPYIISGSLYKDRDDQLAQAPRWITQVCLLDGSQMGDITRNTKPVCIKASKRTSRLTSGNGCIWMFLAAP